MVFDAESAQPLIEAFTKYGVDVDQASVQALLANAPPLKDVKAFANSAITQAVAGGLSDEGKKELEELVAGLKEKEGGDQVGWGRCQVEIGAMCSSTIYTNSKRD